MSAVRLTGTLARDARAFTTPDGTALLEVVVGQGERSIDAVARRRMGTGAAAQFCARNAARALRAGARVTVHAAHWEIDRDQQHLVLTGVDHIEHLDAPPVARGAQPETTT